MRWNLWWHFIQTWGGWGVAVVVAIYHGPKNALEVWDWYMDRFFDYKVREFLESSVGLTLAFTAGGVAEALRQRHTRQCAIPRTVLEISAATKMSERKVKACLWRLKRRKIVAVTGDKWRIVI